VVVTNNHVIEGATEAVAQLSDGREFPCRLIGRDPATDIAVLQMVGSPEEDFIPVKFGDSEGVRLGESVLAIGNPYGLDNTLTVGVISALNRSRPPPTLELSNNVIQTAAARNPGARGGPVVDSRGEVIGVNTAMVSKGAQNIGFAIPINVAKRVIPDLIALGHPVRPWLGFTGMEITKNMANLFNLPVKEGVLVADVYPRSPAARAGIKAGDRIIAYGDEKLVLGGDIIVAMDKRPVRRLRDIVAYLNTLKPGDTVVFTVLRKGKHEKIPVKLGVMPMYMQKLKKQ